MTASTFLFRDLISIKDLSRDDVLHILDLAHQLRNHPEPELLKGKILGTCFFEPSTRTRLSFESAMLRLGGQVIGFSDVSTTSARKGESLYDSMKMLEAYADIITIRHPLEGAAQRAADAVSIPVINAGDGTNQHPTQTLLDLFTIQECQRSLDDLHVAMVGDLKHGRTVHSLAQACAHFNIRLYLVAPSELEMPAFVCDTLSNSGVRFSFHRTIEEILPRTDILYMTRIQEERFSNRMEYERLQRTFVVTPELLQNAKPNLKVLHPLPRKEEIDTRVDNTPFAYYFEQARNGLYIRQALLALLLGKKD